MAAVCPFSADCLETLEEITEETARTEHAGGRIYRYIPALNASGDHIKALVKLTEENVYNLGVIRKSAHFYLHPIGMYLFYLIFLIFVKSHQFYFCIR